MHKVAGSCVHDQGVAVLREKREVRMRNVEVFLLREVNPEWSKWRRVQELSDLIGSHMVSLAQRADENKNGAVTRMRNFNRSGFRIQVEALSELSSSIPDFLIRKNGFLVTCTWQFRLLVFFR